MMKHKCDNLASELLGHSTYVRDRKLFGGFGDLRVENIKNRRVREADETSKFWRVMGRMACKQ